MQETGFFFYNTSATDGFSQNIFTDSQLSNRMRFIFENSVYDPRVVLADGATVGEILWAVWKRQFRDTISTSDIHKTHMRAIAVFEHLQSDFSVPHDQLGSFVHGLTSAIFDPSTTARLWITAFCTNLGICRTQIVNFCSQSEKLLADDFLIQKAT